MGRPRKGWRLRKPRPPNQPNFAVRFTNKAGQAVELTTGTSDPVEAPRIAAELYARDQTGMGASPLARVSPLLALDELMAMWLGDATKTLDEQTVDMYTSYARRFVQFFGSLDRIGRPTMAAYTRERLTKVLRGTVQKERSALNTFFGWCVDEHILREEDVPQWPRLSKKTLGTRSGNHRSAPVDVTVEQVGAFLRALPLWSKPRMGHRHAVRPYFIVAYETSLRPATLAAFVLGEHWSPGSSEIVIPSEDDKARFGRKVPISALAKAALEYVATELRLQPGAPIFGEHDYRERVEAARIEAGLPEDFAPYDLRHGRISHLLDAPGSELRAVMFLAGHTLMTTTNNYVRGQEAGARRLLNSSFGEQSGREGNDMLSAKEGSRTLTGVTPPEPESSVTDHDSSSSVDVSGLERTQKDCARGSFGEPPQNEIPNSVGSAARFLAVLRTTDEALELALADELLGGEQ